MQFLKSILTKYPQLMGKLEAHIKIDNQPYMPLSIEYIGPGPRGLPALSVTHYGEQSGDLMRDSEMCFEMEIEDGTVTEFHPYYWLC